MAVVAIGMRPEIPAAIRTVERIFMRVPPYGRTITAFGFRRMSSQFHFFESSQYSSARPLFRSFIMVRPTVPDDVLHVRTADVRLVFPSPNGFKRGVPLGLLLARNGPTGPD